jgi:molybdopterin-guanine dinucleotide biosynthesis protein A
MGTSEHINGFVLAGGKSRRMGQDKGLMPLAGRPLILRVAEILRPVVRAVTLLALPARCENLGLPVISDLLPDCGPLAAICTGLSSSDAEWKLFLACDLPHISSRLVELLVQRVRAASCNVVVPRTRVGWQPLCAAYHVRCRAEFERPLLHDGRLRIIDLLKELGTGEITPEELTAAGLSQAEFANVNTPEEWAQAAADASAYCGELQCKFDTA